MSNENAETVIVQKLVMTINGRSVEGSRGDTILNVAQLAGISIPTMCNDGRIKPSGKCGLCIVEVNGIMVSACDTLASSGIDIITDSDDIKKRRQLLLTSILESHNAYCEPPCTYACPAKIDIPGYIALIAEKKYVDAITLIREKLPLPGILGRVCPHPCEDVCRRAQVDEPVSICSLKRYAADKAAEQGRYITPEKSAPTGKKVAIVGAGPAGLSAAFYLILKGHDVTLYESRKKAGGMLRYGIPSYRLPDEVLDKEIDEIISLGIDLKLNHSLGKDYTIGSLKDSHDAVFLSFGATLGKKMGIDGEDAPGIYPAVDFLERVNKKERVTVGNKVTVIGGGCTAMDAARAAIRLGAKSVTVIYRRSRDKMPATQQEVHETEAEGVHFKFLSAPKSVVTELGRVSALGVISMQLNMGGGGRGVLEEVPGSEELVPTDMVLLAIGQDVEKRVFEDGLEASRWATVKITESTFQTNIPGVYSAGDCVTGPATVVEAVAGGRRSADAIDLYLRGFANEEIALLIKEDTPLMFNVSANPYSKDHRFSMPERNAADRLYDFDQVELGFDDETAHREALRCMQCGCQEAGVCKLQKYALEYGAGTIVFKEPTISGTNILDGSPFLELNKYKCIKCHACVNICNEVQQLKVYTVGEDNYPDLLGKNYQDTECTFCGQCHNVCPTGALKDLTDRGQHKKNERIQVKTVCPYCGVGCGIIYSVEDGIVVSAQGDPDSDVNGGNLCIKGRFGFSFHNHQERLSKPLIRNTINEPFKEVEWDEAIAFVAKRFTDIRDTHGGDALGALTASRGTNEENYVAQKLFRAVIGTHNVDNCARVCHAPSVQGLRAAFGSGAATNPLHDIEGAEVILVCGSNTTEAHPIASLMVKKGLSNGSKLIVIDPRRIELAERADIFLQLKPGTNVALLNSMAHVIIEEGLQNEDFIKERTEDFDRFKQLVASYSPEITEKLTQVPASLVRQAARLYAATNKGMIFYGLGVTEHKGGSHGVMCLANLSLLTGNIGRPSAGINPLRGQNNVQGACDMGAMPNNYVGYQKVNDKESQEKFTKAYGRDQSMQIGLKEPEMYREAIAGNMKAMYIIGYDPGKTNANLTFIHEALSALDFLVVQDIFPTHTSDFAHVILPAASLLEKEGTFTSAERRIKMLRKVIPPPGDALPDWQITCMIGNAMGYPMTYKNAAEIMDEIAQLAPYFAGVSYERLEKNDLVWPVPDHLTTGTPLMHTTSFIHGKGKFNAMAYLPSEELPDDEYPLYLTTGRILNHYNNASMTGRCKQIAEISNEEFLEINPADASELGIADGELVEVETRRGKKLIKAKLTERSQSGIVFLTFHYDDMLTNFITGPGEDVEVMTPEYKVCAVRINKLALCDA